MNWDMAGAIGELISAVGVILSLFYLAVQIKGNTIASQAASRLDITRDYRAVNTQKLEPRNALAWHVGLWRYPNVDEDDRLLFSYLMSSEALFFSGDLRAAGDRPVRQGHLCSLLDVVCRYRQNSWRVFMVE